MFGHLQDSFGTMLNHLEAILGHVDAILGHLEAILGDVMLDHHHHCHQNHHYHDWYWAHLVHWSHCPHFYDIVCYRLLSLKIDEFSVAQMDSITKFHKDFDNLFRKAREPPDVWLIALIRMRLSGVAANWAQGIVDEKGVTFLFKNFGKQWKKSF